MAVKHATLRCVAGILLGACVALAHVYTHETAPQYSDWLQDLAYNEIASWHDGRSLPPGAEDPGAPYRSACGIGYTTHHPMLAMYVGYAASFVGISPMRAIAGVLALSAALLVYLLTVRRSLQAGLAISGAMGAALYAAPGYAAWMQHQQHTWPVAVVYLIACAALARRPIVWMALACVFAGWVSIDATWVFAGMVGGSLIAAHGFGRTTWFAAAAGIAGFCAANVIHVLQVWCYWGWDSAALINRYFIGIPDRSSVMFRVTSMSFSQRLMVSREVLAAYWTEAMENHFSAWTTPTWWALLLACCVATPRTGRSMIGAAVMVAGAASTAFIAAGLLPAHLHYLVRYVVVTCLGALVCCALAPVERRG